MSDRRRLWALAAVLLLGLGVRFGYGFVRVGHPQMIRGISADAEDYLQIAYTLSRTGRYERPRGVDVKALLQTKPAVLTEPGRSQPDAWRPPVWSWVLSWWLRWSGYDLRIVFALRFLFDGLTLYLFYRVAALGLEPPLALLGTLLLALHPAWLYYSVTLLAEPVILFAHLLFTFAVLRLAEGGRAAVWLPAAGALGAVAILTHSYYVFFPPLLVAGLWLAKRLPTRQALAVLGLMALTLAPWLVRNHGIYGKPLLTTGAGINLAKGWNSEFLAVYRNSAETDLDENVGIDPARLEGLNPAERSALYTARALRYVRSEWRTVPAILAKKLLGAVSPFPDPPRPGILETGRMLFQVVTLLPVLWVVFRGRGSLPWVVRALAGAYLLVALICFPALRYRFALIWVEVLSLCLFLQVTFRISGTIGTGDRIHASSHPTALLPRRVRPTRRRDL